jgi:RHS repeat-associated protein
VGNGTTRIFSWDYRNRLTSVTENGATIATYTYDVMDRRIAKSASGSTTQFVYDGDNVILEFNGTATPSVRYLQGPGVDQVLAQEKAGATSWMLTDHLGTVRDLVNNNGGVVNHFTYDSFGKVLSSTPGGVDTRYKFTGREFDGETGLYYYRARYFDANIGRFIGQDPIGFSAGDSNLYRYVGNSPMSATDPSGMVEWRIVYVPAVAGTPYYHADLYIKARGRLEIHGFDPEKRSNPFDPGSVIYKKPVVATWNPNGPDRRTQAQKRRDNENTKYSQVIYHDIKDPNCEAERNKAMKKAFVSEAKKINGTKFAYRAVGILLFETQNSNSAMYTALKKVSQKFPKIKVPQKPLVQAPGWGKNLFQAPTPQPDPRPKF